MTRARYLLLSAAMLGMWGIFRLTDLDLGAFGSVLLISAAVFGIVGLARDSSGNDERP